MRDRGQPRLRGNNPRYSNENPRGFDKPDPTESPDPYWGRERDGDHDAADDQQDSDDFGPELL
jgi:hypothetical protein